MVKLLGIVAALRFGTLLSNCDGEHATLIVGSNQGRTVSRPVQLHIVSFAFTAFQIPFAWSRLPAAVAARCRCIGVRATIPGFRGL
jgi:hypothetical protein